MKTFQIAVLAGDGIGQEVIPATLEVLQECGQKHGLSFEWTYYDWGAEYYFKYGHMMPPNALELLSSADAILLGAVGHVDIPDNITLNGMLLPIRRGFDQFANAVRSGTAALLASLLISEIFTGAAGTLFWVLIGFGISAHAHNLASGATAAYRASLLHGR